MLFKDRGRCKCRFQAVHFAVRNDFAKAPKRLSAFLAIVGEMIQVTLDAFRSPMPPDDIPLAKSKCFAARRRRGFFHEKWSGEVGFSFWPELRFHAVQLHRAANFGQFALGLDPPVVPQLEGQQRPKRLAMVGATAPMFLE